MKCLFSYISQCFYYSSTSDYQIWLINLSIFLADETTSSPSTTSGLPFFSEVTGTYSKEQIYIDIYIYIYIYMHSKQSLPFILQQYL